ncbi:hypothetical protein K470DRAFT_140471 [Piedraia hortae CBS 480.64]|uniref:Uncharacterized protein n=1 Tax=Piedraia hortae CBS 480.64 TaxID=1314780 RepID=A0A6A7C6E8_9PEZI|nr:hypothetical protein K470DRAFT_140471 [Piedraia hortae CBS 480.64]
MYRVIFLYRVGMVPCVGSLCGFPTVLVGRWDTRMMSGRGTTSAPNEKWAKCSRRVDKGKKMAAIYPLAYKALTMTRGNDSDNALLSRTSIAMLDKYCYIRQATLSQRSIASSCAETGRNSVRYMQ